MRPDLAEADGEECPLLFRELAYKPRVIGEPHARAVVPSGDGSAHGLCDFSLGLARHLSLQCMCRSTGSARSSKLEPGHLKHRRGQSPKTAAARVQRSFDAFPAAPGGGWQSLHQQSTDGAQYNSEPLRGCGAANSRLGIPAQLQRQVYRVAGTSPPVQYQNSTYEWQALLNKSVIAAGLCR